MADVGLQQARQTRGGGGSKGADQVVGVEVQKRLVHERSLPGQPNQRLRHISSLSGRIWTSGIATPLPRARRPCATTAPRRWPGAPSKWPSMIAAADRLLGYGAA